MKKIILLLFLILCTSFVLADEHKEECRLLISSQDVDTFFQELESFNNQLSDCPVKLKGLVAVLVGDGATQVTITGETNRIFYINIEGKKLASFSESGADPKYKVTTDVETFDTILKSDNKFVTIAAMYKQKKVSVEGTGFWSSAVVLISSPFIGWFG